MSSFVAKDIRILSEKYDITARSFMPSAKWHTPFLLLGQFFFLLFRLPAASMIVCQFGGYHSFLPSLFGKLSGKPVLIITGGTDCVSFPSIGYGVFSKPVMAWFTSRSYRWASHIAPVHESLMLCDYAYLEEAPRKQGLLAFVPGITTPYTVIYNGYDPGFWKKQEEKKPGTFITVVAGMEMPARKKLKGIDLVIETASFFPGCEFTIIGVPSGFRLGEVPPNVKTLPRVKNEELPGYYSRSEFYLQLSVSEGFPNALSEAMLCECIPVVSAVGAMPDMVGDAGYILRKRDTRQLKELLTNAIHATDKASRAKKARALIAERYPGSRRLQELLELVEKLLST